MADETISCARCKNCYIATSQYFIRRVKFTVFSFNPLCRICHTELRKERRRSKSSQYWKTQKQKRTEEQKKRDRDRVARWRVENREKYLAHAREWEVKNREKANRRSREYARKNPRILMRRDLSARMGKLFRGQKNALGKTWEGLLGYTWEDLMSYIEKQFLPGMSWGNYRKDTWHIDHKRPVSSFSFTSPDDPAFKACWALSNLQPLWAIDNLRKGAKLPEEPETL